VEDVGYLVYRYEHPNRGRRKKILGLWSIGYAFPRSTTEISSVAGGFHRMTSTVNLPFAIVEFGRAPMMSRLGGPVPFSPPTSVVPDKVHLREKHLECPFRFRN